MTLFDVQLDECAGTHVGGSVTADERHHQPWGIVHGGLYTSEIESALSRDGLTAVYVTVPAPEPRAAGDLARGCPGGRWPACQTGTALAAEHDPRFKAKARGSDDAGDQLRFGRKVATSESACLLTQPGSVGSVPVNRRASGAFT